MFTRVNRVLSVALVVLAALLVWQVAGLVAFSRGEDAAAQARAEATTEAFAGEIAELLERVEAGARVLGTRFSGTEPSRDQVLEWTREASLEFEEVRGVTTCFEPFALDPGVRLFCPYYNKATGEFFPIGDSYDYTERTPGTRWYQGVMDAARAGSDEGLWTEPYYGAALGEWFIDYGVPFRGTDGELAGVVDYALEAGDLQNIVHELAVGRTSFSYITSPEGMFVSHPVRDFVGTRTLQDELGGGGLAGGGLPAAVAEAFAGMAAGGSGGGEYLDPDTGEPMLIRYQTLGDSGFGVAAVFARGALAGDAGAVQRRYIRIALLLSGFLILAAVRWFARDRLAFGEIEGLSWATSAVLLANVVFIGALQHRLDAVETPEDSPPIVDTATLDTFIAGEEARADALRLAPPTAVPTGLHIERMEYADSYNVNMGGVMWQKYPLEVEVEGDADGDTKGDGAEDAPESLPGSLPGSLEVGVHFPQMSPFAEAAFIEETGREVVEGKEGEAGYLLVNYDFRVTLRLNLNYRNFPFDKRHLDIRIAPVGHHTNVILVPDLASYRVTTPSRLPGVDADIELPGSRLVESYYNFTTEEYDTTFGYANDGLSTHATSLHFNIHQKRYLINAFVTYLIPIFVTLALIYILILSTEKTEARQGVIEAMAAFFFVLIFSHIDLRKDIVTADLMFMEFFYFITYLVIILATFNLISYARGRVSYFDWNDNQIFRAVYFPVTIALLLVVMLARFY